MCEIIRLKKVILLVLVKMIIVKLKLSILMDGVYSVLSNLHVLQGLEKKDSNYLFLVQKKE